MKSNDLVELTWWSKRFNDPLNNHIGIVIDVVECSGDVRCEVQWPEGTKKFHLERDLRVV